MKKAFTLLTLALASLGMTAKDYTTPLTVTLEGMVASSELSTVSVDEQADGTYTLSIKNFALGEDIAVGNIVVNGVKAVSAGNVTSLSSVQTIQIADGDDDTKYWMGPLLGDVPITFLGELKGEGINAVLNISFMGMAIGVQLGENPAALGQLPNAGFNAFHTATYKSNTSDEPNGWHSFMSSDGSLASSVSGKVHTYAVDEGAPGSTDGKSVQIKSTSVLSMFSANGTITTGRLHAGSMTATSTDNNSYSDLSTTDVDAGGDPFYTVLTTKPDSIKTWLKYKVGARKNSNKDNVHATISAIINDGTKVQDPEVDDYAGSIIARAQNDQIESKDEAWQEVSIPFTYTDNGSQPKAILVTMSTCSVASGGSTSDSDPDILTVDSVALVYNCDLTQLTYKGAEVAIDESGFAEVEVGGEVSADDFVVTTNAAGAIVTKAIAQEEGADDPTLTITVTAGDLKAAHTYYVTLKGGIPTAIGQTKEEEAKTSHAIYTLDGRQADRASKGLFIIGGKKVLK